MFAANPTRLAIYLAAAYPLFAIAAEPEGEDVVEIVAARQSYRSLSATAATKTETSLKDLPQSARVLTGPLGENLAYRLTAAYEKGDSHRDLLSSKRHMVSPSLIWRVSDSTTLSYEVEQFEQQSYFDRGLVTVKGVLGWAGWNCWAG